MDVIVVDPGRALDPARKHVFDRVLLEAEYAFSVVLHAQRIGRRVPRCDSKRPPGNDQKVEEDDCPWELFLFVVHEVNNDHACVAEC